MLCQIVPVVLVPKKRVPVDVETGIRPGVIARGQSAVAPLHAAPPVAAVPVIATM